MQYQVNAISSNVISINVISMNAISSKCNIKVSELKSNWVS